MRTGFVGAAATCLLLAACTSTTGTGEPTSTPAAATTSSTRPAAPSSAPPGEDMPSTGAEADETTSTASPITAATTSAPAPGAATAPSVSTGPTVSTEPATTTPYVIPLSNPEAGGWGDTHAAYPATDLFENGCGNGVTSPVNGSLLEVRRVNAYDAAVDNPATRGGRSISVLGDDGVRYYLAHFEEIDESLAVDDRVTAGQYLGTIGTTGRSSACHLHLGFSPPCPAQEWSVRRGVVWPYPYLNDWRNGGQRSPADEVAAWAEANPDACATAAGDPFASDA